MIISQINRIIGSRQPGDTPAYVCRDETHFIRDEWRLTYRLRTNEALGIRQMAFSPFSGTLTL